MTSSMMDQRGNPRFASNPERTAQRIRDLQSYFAGHVLDDAKFKCASYEQCRGSHREQFHEGQLHHIGRHYDLVRNGEPFRIVIVGQEYGHVDKYVGLEQRYEMITTDTGENKDFDGRNPHMRGTSSLLRLLLGIELGKDKERECITIGNQTTHIFDVFALVNYLLCSAVNSNGSTRGMSTPTMRRNCFRHFRSAIEILEPTVVVLEGLGIRDWISEHQDGSWHVAEGRRKNLEWLHFGERQAALLTFAHPSASGRYAWWGKSLQSKYLHDTVVPTIEHFLTKSPTENRLY